MRQLTILTILTNLTLSVTSAEAQYSSQTRYVSSSTVRSSASSSYYRRGNFQGYVSPYHVTRGSLYYSRGNFQGYVYRRR